MKKSFKQKIYGVVRRIPRGSVLTYKEVARRAGWPRAWRAVGNVLGGNRSGNVPCHRVVRSDKTVGGYNRGVKKKRALLLREGAL